MECIKYIHDLEIEIQMLEELKGDNSDETITKTIIDKQNKINKCKENLAELSDNQIGYRIYLHMLNGLTPSKAVEKVAEENYLNDIRPCSVASVWEYYKKVKNILKLE